VSAVLLGTLAVTAYVATGRPCADGKLPAAGVTVAAPRSVPLGSRVWVEGVGDRLVEDRTARRFDGRLDLFVGSAAEARHWGKRRLRVWLLEGGRK
jgi:3D (Asp-Asp-Asp) domain-containing protein